MKKLLGISLVAALAVSPMMAMADPVSGTEQSPAITTENQPLYTGKAANSSVDGKMATAGYVKGAYNDAIKAVNAAYTKLDTDKQDNLTETQLNAVNSGITSEKVTSYDNIVTNGATKDGVVATVKSATATASDVSLGVSGSVTGEVSSELSNATATGTATGTVDVVTDWAQETTAPVNLSLGFSGATVTGTVTSSFSNGAIGNDATATGTVSSTVDVDQYHSSISSI